MRKPISNEYKRAYYKANKEKVKAYRDSWLSKNPDYMKNYCDENRATINKVAREYKHRVYKVKPRTKISIREKKNRHNARCAKHKAQKLLRTPSWADLSAISKFYKECPEGYEVDHIVPLRGKNVSGFHILENLQYLPANVNRKKSNLFTI